MMHSYPAKQAAFSGRYEQLEKFETAFVFVVLVALAVFFFAPLIA
mgnify:CR=1 FL=1